MLNEALRLIRIFHDKSQTEVCNAIGISNSYLSEIESGKKQPTLEILNRYAEAFELPVSSLLFFSESLGKPKPSDAVRKFVAQKAVSLLQWAEDNEKRRKPLKKAA